MNRIFIVFLIILHSQVIFEQFTNDVSDGNLTISPSWVEMCVVWPEVFEDRRNVNQFKEVIVLSR